MLRVIYVCCLMFKVVNIDICHFNATPYSFRSSQTKGGDSDLTHQHSYIFDYLSFCGLQADMKVTCPFRPLRHWLATINIRLAQRQTAKILILRCAQYILDHDVS